MRANVNGEMVDIRLSSEGNWIISTSDEKTAHKLNMMGRDHSREMTATEMLGCLFEIRYRHLDSSLDKGIRADVWNFLCIVDSLPDRGTANHPAYKQVITTVRSMSLSICANTESCGRGSTFVPGHLELHPWTRRQPYAIWNT